MSRPAAGIAVVATDESVERALTLARQTDGATIVGSRELRQRLPPGTPFLPLIDLDVDVTPPYLAGSYACYRTLRGQAFAAAVFPDRGGTAYCAARARETGAGLAGTRVVVDCVAPTLRSFEVERRPFISKGRLGVACAEGLALELADGYLCADARTEAWLRAARWRLPPRLDAPVPGEDASRPSVASPRAKPLVSVVIAYHERTRYLEFCLEALARQEYAPLEVVVADDGSRSEPARAQLMDVERRTWPWPLRVLRLASGGPHEARNGGWRAASGELIAFVDDDDVPFDGMVEALWRAREASGADIAVGGARFFRGEGAPFGRAGDVVRIPLCEPRELGLLSNQYGGPVALWPRSLLERLGGFTPSSVEDWVLLARATLHGARATTPPDPVHWYRQTPVSRYSGDSAAVRDAGVPQVAAAFAERLPEDLRLLPLLAAGAYVELERRAHARRPRTRALRARAQLLARRAEQIHADEGAAATARAALRFVARRIARR